MKNVRSTSKLSYLDIQNEGLTGREEKYIYDFVKNSNIALTRGEIAKSLNKEKSSVSARVNSLLNKGLLIEGKKRLDRYSGKLGAVLKVKPIDYLF